MEISSSLYSIYSQKVHFSETAKRIISLSSEQLQNLANHLEQEKNIQELSQPEKNAFEILRNVNIISGHIPRSNVAKLLAHNCICSYFGIFEMPLIYLTLNPCAAHSPIFQIFLWRYNC